ncbi:class II aldolase/adducin family protein [Steroidobacter sp.]|uniref:class II aldolase/adducin family protein n=1 Tax=Steroidobacter sp. TaxID=1978227 RepID=UPI001A5595D5|nr:class II aldolase/adducin family protein [Steroidobacter sp.]MBL8267386.1 class II aldolase/adducin family protein [Steroidobacter sp.]
MIDTKQLPRPPQQTFASPAEQREYNKQQLAATFRLFGKHGFEQGVMGHVSVRDPEFPDQLWMNPFVRTFDRIKVSDLLRIRFDGQLLEGNGYIHPGGINPHTIILKARPDLNAVAHVHSTYGTAWSTLNRLLDPISAEAAVLYERHTIYDTYRDGERENLAAAIGDNRVIIFKGHGIFTVGRSVEEAAYLFLLTEKVCQVQLAVEATGQKPWQLDAETARHISDSNGSEKSRLNFQPYYESIVHQFPDLLT